MNTSKLMILTTIVLIFQGCSIVEAPVKVAYGTGKAVVKGTVAVADAMYESEDERLEKEYKAKRKQEIEEQKKAEKDAKKQQKLEAKAKKQAKKDAKKLKND